LLLGLLGGGWCGEVEVAGSGGEREREGEESVDWVWVWGMGWKRGVGRAGVEEEAVGSRCSRRIRIHIHIRVRVSVRVHGASHRKVTPDSDSLLLPAASRVSPPSLQERSSSRVPDSE